MSGSTLAPGSLPGSRGGPWDAVVVGAGCAGATAARRLADGGLKVLVIEKRGHPGGAAADMYDDAGILIHPWGPHIFHTSDDKVIAFLSRFTAWRPCEHRVAARVEDRLVPVPFNLRSLELAFGAKAPGGSLERGRELEEKLTAAFGAGARVPLGELQARAAQTGDQDLALVAAWIDGHIFRRYTEKQWGLPPEALDPGITARVPVRISREDRYFDDPFQAMPYPSYSTLFSRMLCHPAVTLSCGEDGLSRIMLDGTTTLLDGAPFAGPVIWTGPLDELFRGEAGPLPYRSLDFRFETLDVPWFQEYPVVNYTVSENFTRITEFKRLTGQTRPNRTTIAREYPRPYRGPGDWPAYPLLTPDSRNLRAAYLARAAAIPNLRLAGRLAEFQYYNMDAAVGRALTVAEAVLRG